MNYSNPQLLEALTQRYVIGVMSFRARRRFTRLLDEQPSLKDEVLAWEDRLAPMILSLEPTAPSELVWQRIAREIDVKQHTPKEKTIEKPVPATLTYWPSFSYIAAMLVLAVGVGFTSFGWWNESQKPPVTVVKTEIKTEIQRVPEAAIVSVIGDSDSAQWVTRIYQQAARMDIQVHGVADSKPNNDFELWALQDNGVPVSLGVLPKDGNVSFELNADALLALSQSNTLAISLEPLGGSPKAVPTGPVLYTAALLAPPV
ncbi:anti-sigma factor [bacterium AH-315-K03]|nr:anti-sigma factor [bacterium AH-315-K03]